MALTAAEREALVATAALAHSRRDKAFSETLSGKPFHYVPKRRTARTRATSAQILHRAPRAKRSPATTAQTTAPELTKIKTKATPKAATTPENNSKRHQH